MYHEKHKWGDRLGLLSLNLCHQWQRWHQRKSHHLNLPSQGAKPETNLTTTPVATTDLEADVAALVDAEYDTDELAELSTDSESEAMESEQGEDSAQLEGQ